MKEEAGDSLSDFLLAELWTFVFVDGIEYHAVLILSQYGFAHVLFHILYEEIRRQLQC